MSRINGSIGDHEKKKLIMVDKKLIMEKHENIRLMNAEQINEL